MSAARSSFARVWESLRSSADCRRAKRRSDGVEQLLALQVLSRSNLARTGVGRASAGATYSRSPGLRSLADHLHFRGDGWADRFLARSQRRVGACLVFKAARRYGSRKLGLAGDQIATHACLLVDERVFERERSAPSGSDLIQQESAVAFHLPVGEQRQADPHARPAPTAARSSSRAADPRSCVSIRRAIARASSGGAHAAQPAKLILSRLRGSHMFGAAADEQHRDIVAEHFAVQALGRGDQLVQQCQGLLSPVRTRCRFARRSAHAARLRRGAWRPRRLARR